MLLNDLLLTDVIMPELNGHDLAIRLWDLRPGLLVLFMSGYTANVIVHRGVLDDDVFLLQKPFTNRELAVKVKEVLAIQLPFDPEQVILFQLIIGHDDLIKPSVRQYFFQKYG